MVKLLRLANSARYSPRQAIAIVKDTANSISLQTLRDLALAACVAGSFPATKGFDRLRIWRHAWPPPAMPGCWTRPATWTRTAPTWPACCCAPVSC